MKGTRYALEGNSTDFEESEPDKPIANSDDELSSATADRNYPEELPLCTYSSPIGIRVMALLEALNAARKGSPRKQIGEPRKARNRKRGELSLTEFGQSLNITSRRIRHRLKDIGFLQMEIVVRERGTDPPKYLHTSRITERVVEAGMGRRIEPRSGYPYDVITPKGQGWLITQLQPKIKRRNNLRHEVRDIVHKHLKSGLSQSQVVRLTGASRALVSYHAKTLAA